MGRHNFEIELNGEKYTCRTTFEAIDEFETKANTSIIAAWESLADGKYRFSTIATAIWAAINGERKVIGQKPMLWATVGQMVQEEGFVQCAPYASKFFFNSMPNKDGDIKESEEDQKKNIE